MNEWQYEEKDVHEKSSDIVTYNLFKQPWEAVRANGLTHLFNVD
ncbi:hypothetical protein [Halobacillus salinus]|nr:hypothetical protein [Halobacillus salinus]